MFGVGFQELVLIALIGLIVLGPERLPRVANQIGNWLGQARRMTRVMKRQLEDELDFERDLSIKPPSREPSKQPSSGVPSADDHFSAAHAAGAPGTAIVVDQQAAVTATDTDNSDKPAEVTADDEVASVEEEPVAKEAS
jgi:sec-independent protein translocase protein TatB